MSSDVRPAVIFDLDDTLYDCTGLIKNRLVWKVARALSHEIELDVKDLYKGLIHTRRDNPLSDYFRLFLDSIDLEDDVVDRLVRMSHQVYDTGIDDIDLSEISLFPGCYEMLVHLRDSGWRMFLLTKGEQSLQTSKISMLGIRDFFEGIYIVDQKIDGGGRCPKDGADSGEGSKDERFHHVINSRDLCIDRLVVVGDRPDSELAIGVSLGAKTIQYMSGVYQHLSCPSGSVDHQVGRMSLLREVMDSLYSVWTRKRKIVSIGGGTGQPLLMSGLLSEVKRRRMDGLVKLVSVVAVTDSGRSSGKLRKLFDCPPPGDCRNCLIGMVPDNKQEELHRLFQHRFMSGSGELEGHSIGNLMMVGLTQMYDGDFKKAVSSMSDILGIDSKHNLVLPVCTDGPVDLCAQLENGLARGEVDVRRVGKSTINRIWVEYSNKSLRNKKMAEGKVGVPSVNPVALDEIDTADVVILGPGSFYTSVLCNLVYEGMIDALRRCRGKVVWVANLTTQPGQTDGMSFQDHLNKLIGVLGKGVLDYVVVNDHSIEVDSSVISRFHEEGVDYIPYIGNDVQLGCIGVVSGDLIESFNKGDSVDRNLWQKQDCIRHDSKKLAQVIYNWMFQEF